MKKKLSKILWFGDALNENNQAAPPALSPSDEEHLQGLNLGEIYICVADADPALFIRTSADRIVYFKTLDIEALSKFFIRKDRPDEAGFLIKFLGGLFSDYIQSMNFSSGALGEGFVIKVDSKTGKSYIEVDELFVRIKAMFSELEIKKLSYAGGNYMFTAAGMKCGTVEEHEDFWRCYLLVDDGETAIENPFKEGDQIRFQDFNIKPGVYENVSNRYYWRLCVGVGEDYIDLSKTDCDANSDIPQEGDSLVQLGNRTDKKRQNAITLSVYGDDAPSIHQYAGIDSYSLAGKEVTVISPQGNKFMGDFILKTGINIMTQFKILEDLIYSEISKVLDEVQAKDNYLYNASFASNTNGWETKNDVRFFTVNGKFLLVNDKFYSRKDAMAAVIRDGDRNVLRILSSGIKQSNADLANKPTYEEGEEPGKFFISFRYRVATAGTLTIGFPGQNLYFTERLEPGEEYAMKEYSGTWDGTGDFELKFTGDIYIHSLALAENAFEDLYTKLSSEIKQTAESIRLEVKELSESNNQRFSQIEQTAENLKLSVTKIEEDVTQLGLDINGVTDELKLYVKKDGLGSEINVALDNISVVSKNIYFTGNISANGNVSIQADGTIKAIGGYFEGEINANSGVFKNVRTPNNSLVIDENGNVSIVGKISTASSGTKIEINPNSNSLKFYNSKGYDVGGISFLDSGGGGTSVTYPRLKLDNIASDGNLTASTTLFAGSLSMISNLSGSRYQVSLGIDGLSFYKDGRLTKSYPSS
jgi:FtsZ-binding cell division protein ZapB